VASLTIHFGAGREKFRPSLPPVPARSDPIVRDVRFFINPRSRGGASPNLTCSKKRSLAKGRGSRADFSTRAGSTVLGRRKLPRRGEGSSGLRFDTAVGQADSK